MARKSLIDRLDNNKFWDYRRGGVIHPKKPKITIPISNQTSLQGFGYQRGMCVRHTIGDYFEYLTAAIYGGTPNQIERFPLLSLESQPDIVHPDKSNGGQMLVEVKGLSATKGDCKFFDVQTYKYALIELNQSIYQNARISYAIYVHAVDNITKETEGEPEKTFNELSTKTALSLFMPFSIVWEIFNKMRETNENRSVYREMVMGVVRSEEPMSRFRPNKIYEFMVRPEQAIESWGINPKEYEIDKRISSERINFNRTKVSQFPILVIAHKNHKKWLKEFREKYDDQIGMMRDEIETIQQSPIQKPLFSEEDLDMPEKPDDEIPF